MKMRAPVVIACLMGLGTSLFVPAGAAPRPVLIFVTEHETTDWDLRIKYSDGSFSEPIDPPSLDSPAGFVRTWGTTPTFSPDGSKIAFVGVSYACTSPRCAGTGYVIYTMNIDGTGLTPIYEIHDETFDWVLDPAWSPDGKRIMFVSYYKEVDGRRPPADLWVLDQGSNGVWTPSRLSARPGNEAWPEWSPDGRYIAYEYTTADDKRNSIEISPVDGQGPHRTLVRSSDVKHGGWVTDVAFSPDGKWIAYADYNAPGSEDNQIRVMRSDGSDKRTLISGVRWPWSLDYSPDGRFIVFGEGWKNQYERIVKVQVAPPHRMSVVVDFEESYDHMPEYFPLP